MSLIEEAGVHIASYKPFKWPEQEALEELVKKQASEIERLTKENNALKQLSNAD